LRLGACNYIRKCRYLKDGTKPMPGVWSIPAPSMGREGTKRQLISGLGRESGVSFNGKKKRISQ
jgi:hypothetical protein